MPRFQRVERDPLQWALRLAESYRERRAGGYRVHPYQEALMTIATELELLRNVAERAELLVNDPELSQEGVSERVAALVQALATVERR